MTADYNGWADAPEAEREAMDVYSRQEFEGEALAQLEDAAEEITRAIDALPETYRATSLYVWLAA
jgi:DNA-directed RNA polymerase specialized sigma24 family protein